MSATILATIISYCPLTLSDKLPSTATKRSAPNPFSNAFALAVLTASLSISTPKAVCAPSSRAAMERIPLPQPMSSTVAPGVTTFSSVSKHRRWWGAIRCQRPGPALCAAPCGRLWGLRPPRWGGSAACRLPTWGENIFSSCLPSPPWRTVRAQGVGDTGALQPLL